MSSHYKNSYSENYPAPEFVENYAIPSPNNQKGKIIDIAMQELDNVKPAKPVVTIFSAISSLQKEISDKEKKIKSKRAVPGEIEKLKDELKKKEKELGKMSEAKIEEGKKAIRFLLHYNQNLVKYIVKGYSSFNRKIDHEELTAEGISSLPKAIEKFDLNSKNRFATYAEKKTVIYYDSNYQNEDKESKSYSLLETLHDDENAELTADQVRHQDTIIQTNNLINALGNREAILLIRLFYKIKPSNLLDIYCLATEEEKQELKKKMKLGDKSNPEALQKYSCEEKKVHDLPLVKNYLSLFTKSYRFSELSKILGKSENMARRLKQESFKKLQKLAKERKLHFLIEKRYSLSNNPQKSGICKKIGVNKPRKPNSANRAYARVILKNKKEITVYIPGEKHNLQEYSSVLISGGGAQDLPGVKYHVIRGCGDTEGVKERKQGRSLYGAKKAKNVYQQAEKISKLEKIKVGGWVKSIRESKERIFITLNDGSTLKSLQVVILQENFLKSGSVKEINFGSSLLVSGKLVLTPEREQSCELQDVKIEIVNSTNSDYPLQKKNIPLKTVRDYSELRAKTNYFLAIFRLRHSISKAIHDFFHQEGFYYIPTPIITSNDTEGAGEMFNITTKEPFFSNSAKLTVSGQLQAEALAQGLGKVYTFSPCFRAEKSHTTRHLAEFWMVEPEMVWADLEEITNLAEALIKYVINYVLKNNTSELQYLEKYHLLSAEQKHTNKEIIKRLENFVNNQFKKIDYGEWMDLQSEHEKYLCQYFDNQPVFVLNYPRDLKAFYMKNNLDEEKTVSCFDLLFPEIGELIGGSVREDNYQTLQEKAQKIGLDINNLSLERLIMFISGTENIRDTIAFPRYPGKLEF
ncbi:13439_t:CDS:2 [Entrophospora sp. SA101]|nr:13439_t:CDS:2 [Entrophospora sp. SA101]